MSYCRWSTEGFNCDLYCYEDCSGGWTTHVASNRRAPGWSEEPQLGESLEEWHKRSYAPIGLPHDGESFNDPTLEDFRGRLIYLRELGYQFPDRVLVAVDLELSDEVSARRTPPLEGKEPKIVSGAH